MPVLLITVPGRKTGDLHTMPVLYFEDDGKFLVTGSGAGSAREPQWFKNLRHTDQAEIEIGRRKTPVNVAIASDEGAWHPVAATVAQSPFLCRLPEEDRAADTNGDLDTQAYFRRLVIVKST
jgi:deazaflavin-dependent oxidoreductase (nitroreductase family)